MESIGTKSLPKTQPDTIEVSFSGKTRPLDRFFQECIGSCHAYLTLREDYRQHVREVQRQIGFQQIRFHGLFHDLVGIYREEPKTGQAIYNYQNLDKIFDFFLEQKMRPFVELGFMPRDLASGEKTLFQFQANITPPRDYEKWGALIRDFVSHCIDRWGLAEVLTWRFEVWNEPDLPDFWDGDQAEYFKLYRETVLAVKSVDSRLKVGGPATSKSLWVSELLDYCQETETPVDFISTHHYCADAAFVMGKMTDYIFWRGQPAMREDVAGVQQKIANSHAPNAELHYTEWNVSPCHEDVFGKDSEFTASFVLQTVRDLNGLANSYSLWTISDVFEESGPGIDPFSGKYGLINIHGIPKPVFHAYRFLAQLYDNEIPIEGESLFATELKPGHYRLLVWNFNDATEGRFDGSDYVVEKSGKKVNLSLSGIRPGLYRMKTERVGETDGNSYRAWQQIGSPRYLDEELVQQLKQAALPLKQETLHSWNDQGKIELELGPQEISFIDLEYITNEEHQS